MHIVRHVTGWLYAATASPRFFVGTLVVFVVQAVWLAFSAIYPLPFDEYVHVGVTQIYAKQWLPFIPTQPAEAALFGDVTRNLSFLYHYLMSFPYRLLDVFLDSQMALVVSLRLMNIVMVVVALVLFRRLLLRWGVSRRVTYVVLLAFVCTPVVPFLAAHVNYDNLMLLLTPLFLLLATDMLSGDDKLISRGIWFVVIGLATTLIKENFLPIFLIVALYVLIKLWLWHGTRLVPQIVHSWRVTPKKAAFATACISLLLVGGLFAERYGGNLVRYQTVRPDCAQIHPESVCERFAPWYRNKLDLLNKPADPMYGNPASFSQYWATRMMRGYFALFAHTPTDGATEREPYGPIRLKSLLPLPISVGVTALAAGILAAILKRKDLWHNQYLRFGLVVCGFYVAVLWTFNYQTYLHLGKAEAIQARYTYPLLIVLFLLLAQSISWLVKSKNIKVGLLVLFLALYCWGGGIAGWLLRADQTWYWQSRFIVTTNQGLQRGLKFLVIH